MNNYYYLIASLPSLDCVKNGAFPISRDEFLHQVRPCVSDGVYKLVEDILFDRQTSSPLLAKYNQLKRSMDAVLVSLRAQRLGLEDEKYALKAPAEEWVIQAMEKIVDDPNPLSSELALIDLCAKSLSSLSVFSRFNKRELIFYTIKLKLLLSSARFDAIEGEREFDSIFDSLKFRTEDMN